MHVIKSSSFFAPLMERYAYSPSIALCRVPELELLRRIKLVRPVLDHCCGDGYIAAVAFPGQKLDVGMDINKAQLKNAARRGNYERVEWADAGVYLPLNDEEIATVINNSGIEHIPDLSTAVAEVARVLKPGGKFYFNVLNNRYFERWPLSDKTAESYRQFQPFYHALNEEGWRTMLSRHGFTDVRFEDYFGDQASRCLAELDYTYSAHYFRKRISLRILAERLLPKRLAVARWRTALGDLVWDAAPGTGSGFLVCATKHRDNA
jgi:SAM-dependent methyltransferase